MFNHKFTYNTEMNKVENNKVKPTLEKISTQNGSRKGN